MLIKIKTPTQLKFAGKSISYQAGALVEIPNSNEAKRLIANGQADIAIGIDELFDRNDIGIISPFEHSLSFKTPYEVSYTEKLPFTQVDYVQPVYKNNLVINTDKSFKSMPQVIRNMGKLATLFDLLDTWEVILFLGHPKENASHIAQNEHERTLSIVGDLRIKYYSNLVFGIRDTKNAREFCKVWQDELDYGHELALVRAFYQIKPYAYVLGTDWI